MPSSSKNEEEVPLNTSGNWFSKRSGKNNESKPTQQPKMTNTMSSKPSFTFDNMPPPQPPSSPPSPSLSHRKNTSTTAGAAAATMTTTSKAQALSMTFMKSLSGICCEGCGKDPISLTAAETADLWGNPNNDNNGSNNGNSNDNNSTPSGLYNLQVLQHQSSTVSQNSSISPLVMAPMVGHFSANSMKQYHDMTMNAKSNSNTTMPSTTTATTDTSIVEGLLGEYMCLCQFYQVPYNAGIVTTLRFSLPSLRVSGSFHDLDMVALVELLLRHANTALKFIRRLDFTVASKEGRQWPKTPKVGFTSHGALALAKLLQTTRFVQQVWVPRHRIGPYGASALFLACKENPTMRQLNLRRCRIGERGALVFCEVLFGGSTNFISAASNNNNNNTNTTNGKDNEGDDSSDGSQDQGGGASSSSPQYQQQQQQKQQPPPHGLLEVDLSSNGIGHHGTRAIERAVNIWNAKVATSSSMSPTATPVLVNVEGNLVFPEIMNGVTHGLGVVLSCIGGYLLSKRVQDQSIVHAISCSVYTTSLLVLYLSSTLYHSFFSLQNIKYIFQVMDKCAIYVLIAGSYTPFLTVIFYDKPTYSVGLLSFIWTCCFLGISVEAFAPTWRYRPMFSLSMYLGMGWAVMVCLPEILAEGRLPMACIHLIVLGGVGYTAGVPFFVRDNNLDHAIWHLFVLSGSIFHWLAVYTYVAPTPI